MQGLQGGEQLTGSGEEGEAFSCFAKVAHVGSGHQGQPPDVAPTCLACPTPSTCTPA